VQALDFYTQKPQIQMLLRDTVLTDLMDSRMTTLEEAQFGLTPYELPSQDSRGFFRAVEGRLRDERKFKSLREKSLCLTL